MTAPSLTTLQTRQFDAALFSAALDFYGLPADYNRTFTTGGKPCQPNQAAPVWVQVNPSLASFRLKKAERTDIATLQNITLDFEYPPDPTSTHRLAIELADRLVSMGLAEPGLPVEDSGAGAHIVIPIAPLETAQCGGGDLVNDAVAKIVETYIKPEFDQLAEAYNLAGKIKLEAFNIDRVLSAPGTWRPFGLKKTDANAVAYLREGYLRRWLPPFDGDNYPIRKESETLSQLVKAFCINLQTEADQPTRLVSLTNSTDAAAWLASYMAKRSASGDRSTDFHALITACYLRFDAQTARDNADLIDQLAGGKYAGRASREAERSLKKAERLPKTDRAAWYSQRGYQYPKEPAHFDQAKPGASVPTTPPTTPSAELNGDQTLNLHHLTDQGNARRLIERFGHNLKYVTAWGWLVWDGKRWEKDETGAENRYAKKTVATIYTEAGQITDPDKRKATASWATKSEASGRIAAMLHEAESEIEIVAKPQDFDRDPWLLNCLNGTLNLKTGQLQPHNPADLITKIVPVEFDPEATCPTWEKFLDRAMDFKQEMTEFLQRAVGYSLTGSTNEQCFFFAYGMGANGKSVFLETLQNLFGDYARATNANTFLAKDRGGDGPSSDIARLVGARFVKAVESEAGRRWAEALLKELTGGDTVTARFLFQKEFSFKPVLKLWFAANHKPIIVNQDNGIWRRVRLIPFNVTIPREQQDRHLTTRLQAELSGILTWAVQGCLEWQKFGSLKEPSEVLQATQDYKEESDTLRDFIADCCVTGRAEKYNETLAGCYKRYFIWAKENYEQRPMPKRAFSQALGERGFLVKGGAKNRTTVYGLKLLEQQAYDQDFDDENTLFDS